MKLSLLVMFVVFIKLGKERFIMSNGSLVEVKLNSA